MFSAGLSGYNVTRGLLGALKRRAVRTGLIDELLQLPDDASCRQRLRAHPFLEGIEVGASPGELERALLAACATFARRIRNFLGGPAGRFIEAYSTRYELHNAKLIFRASLNPGSGDLSSGIYPVSKLYTPARLAAVKAPADIVASYEESELARIIREAYETFAAASNDLALFEVVLDRSYTRLLWEAAEHIHPMDGVRLRDRVLLPWLGSTAVVWVLWLSRHRRMSVEELIAVLDFSEKVFPSRLVAALAQEGDMTSVAAEVRGARLRGFLSRASGLKDLSDLHRASRRFLWDLVTPGRMETRFDISTLLSALVRWELIVEDAITVAAGRSLGLGGDEIKPLLATQAA